MEGFAFTSHAAWRGAPLPCMVCIFTHTHTHYTYCPIILVYFPQFLPSPTLFVIVLFVPHPLPPSPTSELGELAYFCGNPYSLFPNSSFFPLPGQDCPSSLPPHHRPHHSLLNPDTIVCYIQFYWTRFSVTHTHTTPYLVVNLWLFVIYPHTLFWLVHCAGTWTELLLHVCGVPGTGQTLFPTSFLLFDGGFMPHLWCVSPGIAEEQG